VLLAVAALAGATPAASADGIVVSPVLDVSGDSTAQTETPIAVEGDNLVIGANDYNLNHGCGVNFSADDGSNWTSTYPHGFVPGLTKTTDDPAVPGTGAYDVAGDPSVAIVGGTVYYACLAFDVTSPFQAAIYLNTTSDGGDTWQHFLVSRFQGNGVTKGSLGQAVDHENLRVAANWDIYVTWAQINGGGPHSPIEVAVSHDGGESWSLSKVTAGKNFANEDARIVTDGANPPNAYLVFDNMVPGGNGFGLFAAKSTDRGLTWSKPVQFTSIANPLCLFPPTCFNIAGGAFRGPGTYPAPAFDFDSGVLWVAAASIEGDFGQVRLYELDTDLKLLSSRTVTDCTGDCFGSELAIAPDGRLDLSYYDRSYSGNALVDLTYATSSDGGSTWDDARVTASGFDPSSWGVPVDDSAQPFIGDYNGIASTNDKAYMAWTGVGAANTAPFNLEIDFATATPPA
jgi:hypothetical protein